MKKQDGIMASPEEQILEEYLKTLKILPMSSAIPQGLGIRAVLLLRGCCDAAKSWRDPTVESNENMSRLADICSPTWETFVTSCVNKAVGTGCA